MSRAEFLNKHGLPHGFFFPILSRDFSIFLVLAPSLFCLSLLFFKRSGGVHRLTDRRTLSPSNSPPLTPGSQKKDSLTLEATVAGVCFTPHKALVFLVH